MPIGEDFVKKHREEYQRNIEEIRRDIAQALDAVLNDADNWIQDAYTKGYEHGLYDGAPGK